MENEVKDKASVKGDRAFYILFALFGVLVFFAFLIRIGFVDTIRLFSSTVFVFFLPGFIWSFVFFKKFNSFSKIGRVVFAVAFSIVTIPLIEFYLNRFFHVAITKGNVVLEITIFTLIGLLIYFLNFVKIRKTLAIIILLFTVFSFSPKTFAATEVPVNHGGDIEIKKIAGDKQIVAVNQGLEDIVVRVVTDSGSPVSFEEVIFTLYDSHGNKISDAVEVVTDENGYAHFKSAKYGPGSYVLKAELKNGKSVEFNVKILGVSEVRNHYGYLFLLLIIPLLFLIAWLLQRKVHFVYGLLDGKGVPDVWVDFNRADRQDISKIFSTNRNGNFVARFAEGEYSVKLSKEGYFLDHVENHPELKDLQDGRFSLEIKNSSESLRFAMKKRDEENPPGIPLRHL